MGASFLSSSLIFSCLLLALVLGFACPAHAGSTTTKIRTAQFRTTGTKIGIALALDFNTTYPAYSVLASTTINSLLLNKSETPAHLNLSHTVYRVVGNTLDGFSGPEHFVLPTNDSTPVTYVDSFDPCRLIANNFVGNQHISVRADFFSDQVIYVYTTVKVELTDVTITADEDVVVPTATTQYFAIDVPDNVTNVTVLLAASGEHSDETLSSVFHSLTFGCGAGAQVVYFTDAHTKSSVSSASVKPGSKLVLSLEMAAGVPVPKAPSFILSVRTGEHKEDDSEFWKPWVIGVIAGAGIALVLVALIVAGVIIWKVRGKHGYETINY